MLPAAAGDDQGREPEERDQSQEDGARGLVLSWHGECLLIGWIEPPRGATSARRRVASDGEGPGRNGDFITTGPPDQRSARVVGQDPLHRAGEAGISRVEREPARTTQRSFSLEGSKVGLGNFIFIDSRVSTMIWDTATSRNHFLSAGMMYQGPHWVLHRFTASS